MAMPDDRLGSKDELIRYLLFEHRSGKIHTSLYGGARVDDRLADDFEAEVREIVSGDGGDDG